MARRGRPRHPDILTPREWDVLALLRDGFTNDQIAQRLDITERTAKFHVSEILGKLGVSSREEAASWQPEERRTRWLAAAAPLGFIWRRAVPASMNAAGLAVGGAMFAAVVAGIVLLALLLPRGDGSPGTVTSALPRIAFSAGGSIYAVRPDGTDLRKVISGAAPALSPDGSRIAFPRDEDIWIANADGTNVHRLAAVADLHTPPDHAASNWSLGAQSVAWSPDGKHIAYVMGRIGGSGIQDVWVMRSDASERTRVYHGGGPWVQPTWLDNERLALYEDHGRVRVFRLTGEEETSISLPAAEQRYSIAAIPAPGGNWLVGPLINEGPIMYGQADALRQIASGVAPAISPDGQQVTYLRGDSLRVIAVDGAGEHEVANLTPLGGRDHMFAEQPTGLSNRAPSGGYIPPEISWAGAQASKTAPAAIIDQPGIYVMQADGSHLHRLAGDVGTAGSFAWAPEGTRFAYTPYCDSPPTLYWAEAADGKLAELASLTFPGSLLFWHPTGKMVAMTEDSGGQPPGVVLVAIANGAVERIDEAVEFVGWSYDGRFYTLQPKGGTIIVDRGTGTRVQLEPNSGTTLWSPTDDRFAFTYLVKPSEPPYNAWLASGIDIMNSDGTNRTVVLPAERHAVTGASEALAWSPDGRWLLIKPATTFHYLLEDTSGQQPTIDLGPGFKLATAVWSPDGQLIALERSGAPTRDVYIELVSPTGMQQKILAIGDDARDPRFAPDGTRLTFLQGDPSSGMQHLYITDVTPDGSPALLAKTDGHLTMTQLGWSADGRYLAFLAYYPSDRGPCGTPATQAP